MKRICMHTYIITISHIFVKKKFTSKISMKNLLQIMSSLNYFLQSLEHPKFFQSLRVKEIFSKKLLIFSPKNNYNKKKARYFRKKTLLCKNFSMFGSLLPHNIYSYILFSHFLWFYSIIFISIYG